MKSTFEHKGKMLTYSYDWIGTRLWVHVNGKTFLVEQESNSRKSKRRQEGAGHDKVIAPMPGKVTKVLVAKNQQVQKGQAILVMEAMKMEYTLKSEIPGKVQNLKVQAGDQVSLGQVLVDLMEVPS